MLGEIARFGAPAPSRVRMPRHGYASFFREHYYFSTRRTYTDVERGDVLHGSVHLGTLA
jgi:hypothetical protein